MKSKLIQKIKRAYGLFKTIGLKNTCPICSWSARYFYDAGFDFPVLKKYKIISAGFRHNVRCPRCNSSERERLIYLFLKRKTKTFLNNSSILHVAPEKSLQKVLKKRRHGTHVSVDINSPFADIVADIQAIPYGDHSFDVIICSHVLEHVPDDLKAMREFVRVLKLGGIAILQVPYSPILKETYEDWSVTLPVERERVFGQTDHVRIYGTDYPDRLSIAGFKVETILPHTFLTKKEIVRYSLNPEESVFFCSLKSDKKNL
ncbi:MAG: methyltransferase domain-containing protein [Patescibacteria group bacterium]